LPVMLYGLSLTHKHLPEMQMHCGLDHPPLFQPCVGDFSQGQFISVPLQLWALPGRPSGDQVHQVLARHYAGSAFVSVAARDAVSAISTLDPQSLNGTNDLAIYVFSNDDTGQAWLVAIYDNLGKGASGAAVQNLNLMLGAEATTGLMAA
ncbi:MAG: N-acetyl-gamma-glutamyl-phosphate reductase, partial [Alphaproteobacteria bacterium]